MSSLEWDDGGLHGEPIDHMLEAKLRPPALRSEWVARSRLLDNLRHAAERPVTLISAPAGYGKSTLVTQWLASGSRPATVAWISLDAADNDPARLWSHIATALDRAGCIIPRDVAGFIAAGASDLTTSVLPMIIDAIAARFAHITLVIDDFQLVSADCSPTFDFLIEHLPVKAHLVLISRSDPALRLGRLRAAGKLSEIRADDLAFNVEEASSLLSHHVRLPTESVSELMRRTEGWPAGLYLATLSLAGRADPSEFVHHFSGNNRFIGEYLTEEVLSRQTEEMRNFILDASVLDRVSAPLADYMTRSRRSAHLLRELEHSNLFLIPLDDEERWFRFHHLFGAVARSALESEQPDHVPELHQRAADWLSKNGYVVEAVPHALAAGAVDQAASLVQANWLRYFDAGLAITVRGWLQALEASTADELCHHRHGSLDGGAVRRHGRAQPTIGSARHHRSSWSASRWNEVRGVGGSAHPRAVWLRWPIGDVGLGPPRRRARDGRQYCLVHRCQCRSRSCRVRGRRSQHRPARPADSRLQ